MGKLGARLNWAGKWITLSFSLSADAAMSTDDFHTNALERAVAALLSGDARTLQNICERINQPQLNLCLVPTALSCSVECLQIVVEPLKGLYNSSLDCLNLLTLENVDEDRLKVLLPFSNPATVHTPTQHTLWSIGLLLKLPCSFYQGWNPDSQTVAEALPKMKDCNDVELLRWCVKKVAKDKKSNDIASDILPAWDAAQNSTNFPFLELLASEFNFPNCWIEELQKKWPMWEAHYETLTNHPSLAALVVSVAIEKSHWRVVHTLLGCAKKDSSVVKACLATQNIFACNWIFSQGFRLSAKNLWDQISSPETRPLTTNSLAFFTHLLECDKKWSMGAWEELKQECGSSELFCQLLMHGEDAADLLRSDLDPAFSHSLPLRLACVLGRERTVRNVLEFSDPQIFNSQALALAAINGHSHIMKMLMPHCDPNTDSHRALSCALWFDRQNNTDKCSSLLITSETPPEKMVEVWRQQIAHHSGRPCVVNGFSSFGQDKDMDNQMHHVLHHLLSDLDEIGEMACAISPNELDFTQTYCMSWSNFDQPIEKWWSSLTSSDLTKMGHHLLKVFPNALKNHLCNVNEKDKDRQKRKI